MGVETAVAARYARDGYVVPDWRVPDDLLAEMRAALDRLIADNPHIRPEHLVLRWGGGADELDTDAGAVSAGGGGGGPAATRWGCKHSLSKA